jgi:hypothetical protein
LNESTGTRRTLSRLATGLLTAALAIGAFGATEATATVSYPTSTQMILHNVPPADLLANTRGVCDGQFQLVIRNVGTWSGARAYLDAAQHCGLKAILHYSPTISGGTIHPSRVAGFVGAVKNLPALFGYLSVKEPAGVGVTAREIRTLYAAYKAADPSHPVIALFGDIPHFGSSTNPYTAKMANIVMVDWYPVETASRGCSSSGSSYIPNGPKWFSTKVRPIVAARTPGVPIWVMVQTHKYLHAGCHKKQRPSATQLTRQVHEALRYAGATGIAFQTFRNTNYQMDEYRDGPMVATMKSIADQIRNGIF